jgi:hypothetical protein
MEMFFLQNGEHWHARGKEIPCDKPELATQSCYITTRANCMIHNFGRSTSNNIINQSTGTHNYNQNAR